LGRFSVTCETCHARLRVRDPGVVGQIHACPKCGSMVYIVPPAGWSPPPSDIVRQPPALPGDGTVGQECPPADPPLRVPAGAGGVPLAKTAVSRLVWWSAAGAGLLVVGGVLAAVWTRGGSDAVDTVPQVAETVAVVAPTRVAEVVPPVPVEQSEGASDSVGGIQTGADSSEAPTNSLSSPAPAEIVPTVVAEQSEDASGSSGDLPSEAESSGARPGSSSAKFGPLNFDPSQLSLSSSGVPEMVPPGPERSEDTSERLGDISAEADSAGTDSLPSPATAAVRLGPASSGALRSRNVAEQLSLKIDAIDLPQVPLARALEMISDLADVPITLEPSALEMSGISPDFRVTLHAESVTIAGLLQTAVAQANLAYESQAGQIVVTKPDVDRRRSVNYRVDDLVAADATDATQLAKMIERFIAPETWQSAGGMGTIVVDGSTLRVDQSDRVLYQVLTFCERLRLARGLATRSRYPVDRLRIEPLYAQMAERLSAKTTFTFLPWSRLADVFRHWEDAADVTVLVDWSALAETGLAPSSPVACAVADRTWTDALDAILAPLGLAYWPVDAQTIQITSRDAVSRIRQIEFYPVSNRLLAQYASRDALIAALADEAKKQVVGGPPIEIDLDAPSHRLVVLAPPAVHRCLSDRLSP
jgi:hypothetical protein